MNSSITVFSSSAREVTLLHRSLEGFLQQLSQAFVVGRSVTDGGRGHDRSSSILDRLVFPVHELVNVSESWLRVGPDTCVLGLLLCPAELGIWIVLKVFDNLLEREGAKRFGTENCNIVVSICLSLGLEIIVDLTRANNNFSDLVTCNELLVLILEQ